MNSLTFRLQLAELNESIVVRLTTEGILRPRLCLQESTYSDSFGILQPAVETIATGTAARRPAAVHLDITNAD